MSFLPSAAFVVASQLATPAYADTIQRPTNIATNPVAWAFELFGLSISHAMHPRAAIRADGNLAMSYDLTGHEVGLTVPIYLWRVYHGPFIEPGVMLRKIDDGCDSDVTDDCDERLAQQHGPQLNVGYHLTSESGLNIALAVGAMWPVDADRHWEGLQLAGYFRLGYAY